MTSSFSPSFPLFLPPFQQRQAIFIIQLEQMLHPLQLAAEGLEACLKIRQCQRKTL